MNQYHIYLVLVGWLVKMVEGEGDYGGDMNICWI